MIERDVKTVGSCVKRLFLIHHQKEICVIIECEGRCELRSLLDAS